MDDEDLNDLFGAVGNISIKRLFGGKSIYHDGLIIGLVVDGELLLKADEQSAPEFLAAGCKQWAYTKRDSEKSVAMPYWSVPDSALDDRDVLAQWAHLSIAAAQRARSKRKYTSATSAN